MMFVLVFAFLLTFVAHLGQAIDRPPVDYLQVGGNPHTSELKWIIEMIQSGYWGLDPNSIGENLKQARLLALNASLHGVDSIRSEDHLGISNYQGRGFYWLNNVLADFLAFSHQEQVLVPCHNAEARTFIGIVDMQFGGLENFQKLLSNPPNNALLFNYLKQYAFRHMEECLSTLKPRLESSLQRLLPGVEEKMDILVGMGEKYPVEEADIKLTVRASHLDLAEGEFDAKRMMEAIKNYILETQDEQWMKFVDSPGLLTTLITEVCDDLRLKMPFDMYNLARLVTPNEANKVELPYKFIKLNEYSRVCIPFYKRSTKKDAQKNVMNNMIRLGL